ncbi:tyrosine-protein phosphatase non-receptor type 5 isoform X2 [Frankliniella occidentalis]|uniref:protein-tyrosine-phosphatase n=1 Tax=Frankliniella occidentalis TaxID=133901 RepID=A0A9C6U598_FRAOC|nr:tyrosine-protein phosphatase non-receptor type 5 isoform X2 [Frankliniella occidentalis]
MENGPGKGAAGQKTMASARQSVPDSELSQESASSSSTENVIWSEKRLFKQPGWTEWQYPVLFSFGVIAVGFVMLLWFKSQMLLSKKKKDCEELESMTEAQDIVSQTTNTTVTAVVSEEVTSSHCWKLQSTSSAVQETCVAEAQLPEALRQSAVVAGPSTSSCGAGNRFASEIRPEPIRIKAKGLLERRGSSASLTIDLHPSQENISTLCGPTRECTDEYLLSAGNMLSRQQLRKCLEDVHSLHREFWEIPSNHSEHVGVAGAGFKNRYKTILPNERTRVQISPPNSGMTPGSAEDQLACYINANYIRGYDGEDKAYIATQGPLPNTIIDFWLMVWGEGVSVIVMITRFVETCKCKCEPYIPMNPQQEDGESPPDSPSMSQSLGGPGSIGKYGDITVSVEKVLPRDGYVVRELRVQRGDETRLIQHYWYDTWPDHKTPDTARSIVELVREVEAYRQKSLSELRKQYGDNVPRKAPVIVHCSAGIGRTGCFLAVAIGTIQLAEENNVDVLGIVCRLRHDRGGMVQTAEQYEFIHRALCEFEKTLPNRSGEIFGKCPNKLS